ncbi:MULTISPECIES: TetR/AcrR family transcriptional regulator [unclassified Nostoc]|uniref:TetR/AcrR family transcriptional regulator n=1 Tax=unclassified Nostoc TaxID=2593658 RepID=UPI0025AACCC3|nr:MULTISPECIES: TetR/AcrR family transcriptional regulator [unclassified Nostoc]MDM9585134.1 TetR/AcrR family transcriptional regulator [Nostoc sp. GT001]MDZ7947584.1 TetR/AcrR family transcriptional regulator [Nostoc sp. EfeVER01]MDZ7994019.1 TetR/AcrR family transcriptional regulator [Nostoc sp. EspVER01]
MSESVKNSPGRPRSVLSHQAILKAALDLLAEVGYERMSIEAIAARAGVGKPTIYRRYSSKEELVADAIESLREEISIPDTGSLWSDLDLIIESAARTTLTPLGCQIKALILSTASSSPQFSQVYWAKYLQPRRQAFRVVIERAKTRNEIQTDTDSDLIFDLMSGAMLYAQIFPPTSESWEAYIRRALELFVKSNLPT